MIYRLKLKQLCGFKKGRKRVVLLIWIGDEIAQGLVQEKLFTTVIGPMKCFMQELMEIKRVHLSNEK